MSIFTSAYWMKISPRDWLLRLISLGLATVLWYFVGGEDIVNKNVMIPVEVINLPNDLVISNQFKKEIEVSVIGPRSLVLDIGNRAISRQVDLAEAKPGTMVIENRNSSISVPRGVKVKRIQPASIILSLDKLIQKRLVVNPVTSGTIASDYLLKGIRMEPDSIAITGPQTVIEPFEALRTKVIEVGGLRASTTIQVPLELDTVIVDLIGETTVTAYLDISVKTVQKKISNLPVEVIVNDVLQRVTPASVSITAAFPKTIIREDISLRSLFKVTATEAVEGKGLLVQVTQTREFPDPIRILQIEPKFVTLIKESPPVAQEPAPEAGAVDAAAESQEKAAASVTETEKNTP